jgi:hypothetical protein
MLKRRSIAAARLFAVVGGTWLALSICLPRATAARVPPFSNTNYRGRYICSVSSRGNFFTAIMLVMPSGTSSSSGMGTYRGGTLFASVGAFFAFDPTVPPKDNFCSYALDTSPKSSFYVVGSNGLTTEVLTWMAAAENNPACPATSGSFIMSQETVLGANVDATGEVQNTSISSGNLLDQDLPGDGYCAK